MKENGVLLVYSGWLGDLVWIVPTLHALKTAFQTVSMVVSEVQAPLANIMQNGLVDKVFVDESSRRLASARAVRRAALEMGIDTFVDLKGRGKTGLYMPWGGASRIMIPHRKDAREYALARLVHPFATCMSERGDGHMVDAYLQGLEGLGVQTIPVSFEVPFSNDIVEAAQTIIEDEGLKDQRCIAINPGSAQFCKIWPGTHFRRLADILMSDFGCKVVLMGGRDFAPNGNYDVAVSRDHFSDSNVINLVEKTPLAIDAYLLYSGVFTLSIGNDSFANHMAGSASEMPPETPGAIQADNGHWYKANRTVSLFAPTNPAFCRPYDPTGRFNTIVQPDVYPDTCVYDRKAHVCPHYGGRFDAKRCHCMANLSVDKVVAAVAPLLG